MTPFSTGCYGEMVAAYEAGDCDAYTADQSALYGHRTKLKNPTAHVFLPELISKEPLGPVVREDEGDNRWVEVIRWTLYTMLEAEERGIDSGNVDDLRKNSRNRSCPRKWCKSSERLTVSGGLSRIDQAAVWGSLIKSS